MVIEEKGEKKEKKTLWIDCGAISNARAKMCVYPVAFKSCVSV